MKSNSLKVDSFFLHLFYILTVISLYFLNNNRYDKANEIILNTILSFVTLIFAASLCILFVFGVMKLTMYEASLLALIFIIFILTYLFRQFLSIHFIYLLSAYYVVKSKAALKPWIVYTSVILCFISIIIQMCLFDFLGRPVLSHYDPNYSGFYIFTFFLFCYKYNYKIIAYLVAAIGFLTLSRNYMLAIVLFTVFSNGYVKTLVSKARLVNFYPIFFIGIFLPIIVGTIFLGKAEESGTEVNAESSASRLFNFQDRSNEHRFMANALFLADLYDAPKKYYWGRDLAEYTENVFMNSPHNSFFQLLLNYGIFFTFIYILLFGNLANQCLVGGGNIPYIFSLLIYFIFLGGGIYGIQIIYLFFILRKNEVKVK